MHVHKINLSNILPLGQHKLNHNNNQLSKSIHNRWLQQNAKVYSITRSNKTPTSQWPLWMWNIYTHVPIVRPRCYIISKQSYYNNNLRLGPKCLKNCTITPIAQIIINKIWQYKIIIVTTINNYCQTFQ